MAGSFTSPSGAPAKMKVGKANRPKRTSSGEKQKDRPEYPITDSFASSSIPSFAKRHFKTNGKSGFHTHPGQPPAGHMKPRTAEPNRGSGKEHRAKG